MFFQKLFYAAVHDWEENGPTVLSFLRTFSQMGHRQISKRWREKRFSRRDERCKCVSCFLQMERPQQRQMNGFFNPRLFDLIRPICICSRVMVRMKAAAVIAFSRRIQHPPHLLLPLYCNYSCSLPLQSFAFATNAFVSTLWCEI